MKTHLTFALIVAVGWAGMVVAGIRTEGTYSGVVIFDRWGACTLYSGIYVMYVSQEAKKPLRPLAGECVVVDATQVEQRITTDGDGLIKKLTVLGPAPPANAWAPTRDLTIAVARAFDDGDAPEFIIRLENIGDEPVAIHMNALAPTLLAAKANAHGAWSPSDGPSIAAVTRQSFWSGDAPRMNGGNGGGCAWTVTKPRALRRSVTLKPKGAFEIRLSFDLPAGEYEFLAGYGGGVHQSRCIASNLIGFDVKEDGTVSFPTPTAK